MLNNKYNKTIESRIRLEGVFCSFIFIIGGVVSDLTGVIAPDNLSIEGNNETLHPL